MFDRITPARVAAMSEQERRWLNNIKKAVFDGDNAYTQGRPEDHCFEALCKAIDTAKTLRRSLRAEDWSSKHNKARFTEFLNLEIPGFRSDITLFDARGGREVSYCFSELIYAIRCMVHENENLNVAEQPDYHVLLDWSRRPSDRCSGVVENGRITLNARSIWLRLREVLVKFVQGLEGMIAYEEGRGFSMGRAPFGSIRPDGHDAA